MRNNAYARSNSDSAASRSIMLGMAVRQRNVTLPLKGPRLGPHRVSTIDRALFVLLETYDVRAGAIKGFVLGSAPAIRIALFDGPEPRLVPGSVAPSGVT